MWKKSKNTRYMALLLLLSSSLFSPFLVEGQERERQQEWRQSLRTSGAEEGSEIFEIATQCIDDMSTEACKKMTIYTAEFLNNWTKMTQHAEELVERLQETEQLLIHTHNRARERTEAMRRMNEEWEEQANKTEMQIWGLWAGVWLGVTWGMGMTIAYFLKE